MKASIVFDRLTNARKKIVVSRGGTRSSKTMSLCLKALMWLLTSEERGFWSICRKTLPALKASALRDFEFLLFESGAFNMVAHNKTELTFTFGDRTVEFYSLDDPQKVRSRKRTHLHLVEANEIDFETFIQLVLRTTGQVHLDFNPDDVDAWMNTKIEQERSAIKGDVDVIVSTYLDNPFLSIDEIEEIEYLKLVDPELWSIFGEGQYGKITGLIYKSFTLIDEMPDIDYHIGLDFGFKHPAAAVKVAKENQRLYLDEIFYARGKINAWLIEHLLPYKNKLIVADCAEPKSIEDLDRGGLRIVESLKGPDSVRHGISAMQEYELMVTKRSVNLIKELQKYRLDKDGDPITVWDDALSAARYVVQTKFKRANVTGQTIKVNKYANAIR